MVSIGESWIRTDPDSATIADSGLAHVTMLPNRARHRPEFSVPQRYLKLSQYLLVSPASLRWGRPIDPDSAGITTRRNAWKWLYRKCREKIGNSDWRHMAYIDGLHRIFSDAQKEVADCEYPLDITP